MSNDTLLEVNHLKVEIHAASGNIHAVNEVSFKIEHGEIFSLLGESGCGKTMTALAINRLLPHQAKICQGSEILLEGIPLHQLSECKMQKVRAKKIGMIFQDPALALNPVLTIGEQLSEAIYLANLTSLKKQDVVKQMLSLLENVRIPDREAFLNYYPHQLSGGMKQRIVIAMALAKSPDLLIADEPTTALDVTTQAQVLSLLKELNQKMGMAILLISHDLGVVQQMANHIAVMYAGHIVEKGTKTAFFIQSKHPYSTQLFASLPEHTVKDHKLATIPGQVPSLDQHFSLCRFKGRCEKVFSACEEIRPKLIDVNQEQAARCLWYDESVTKKLPKMLNIKVINEAQSNITISVSQEKEEDEKIILNVKNLKVYFPIQKGLFKRTVGYVKAVDDVSFHLPEGRTLALVGESGCGKTTVGRAITRLLKPYAGLVEFHDNNLLKLSEKKLRSYRSHLQMIFQDPYSAMDPRFTVEEIIREGMLALKIGTDHTERQDRVNHLLEQVGLSQKMKHRYPHELSGGQRQRIAIARALAVGAELLICDEPTSALDVSVQAQILNLLRSLQNDLAISYLFITHNIAVVNYLADYVAVMYLGKIVEYGPVNDVINTPKHPYTQALLASVPSIADFNKTFIPVKGEIPSPSHPPAGCHFSPRCPKAMAKCFLKYPDKYDVGKDHTTQCYLYAPAEKKEKMSDK